MFSSQITLYKSSHAMFIFPLLVDLVLLKFPISLSNANPAVLSKLLQT